MNPFSPAMSAAKKEVRLARDVTLFRQGTLDAAGIPRKRPQFRILIIGKANSGKTTILRKVVNASPDAKPVIYDAEGKVVTQKPTSVSSVHRILGWKQGHSADVLNPSTQRGEHNIECQLELTYPGSDFVFHDSRGIEAGSENELKTVKEFIQRRDRRADLKDQLHAIWYCVPMDDQQPISGSEKAFFSMGTGKVPVLLIFTKFDVLEDKCYSKLRGQGMSHQEAKNGMHGLVNKTFQNEYLPRVLGAAFPPKAYVCLTGMDKEENQCTELLEKTIDMIIAGGHLLLEDKDTKMVELGTQGHVPTVVEECPTTLSACVLGPLNISRLLTEKGPNVEVLLVGAGIRSNDFFLGAAFDRDLIPSGIIVEEAHILTRQELKVDDQTRSDLLDKLGLLLSPYRAIIFTPSNQYRSTPYLSEQRCAYEQLIEFQNSSQLEHNYSHLALTPLADQDESGGNPTGSSGAEFSRGSSAGNGPGSQREGVDPNGHEPTGPPDDSSHKRGRGQGNDPGDDGEEKSLGVPGDIKVHFRVLFKIQNSQTIRVEGCLSSKDSTTAVSSQHFDMVSACDFQFRGLDFESNSDFGAQRPHRQFYAKVNIDWGTLRFALKNPKPTSTPRQSNIMKEVQVQDSSNGIQATGTVKGLGVKLPSADVSVGGSKTTKQGSSHEVSINMNRIKQGQTRTGAHWGYMVDDHGTAETGLRLTGNPSDLPSATITFLGKQEGSTPPKNLKVKIDSYWTMPATDDGWFTGEQPILRDLGVCISFNIPPHLKGSWNLFRDMRFGEGGIPTDEYVAGIPNASDVEFSTPSFRLSEKVHQDPHNYQTSTT